MVLRYLLLLTFLCFLKLAHAENTGGFKTRIKVPEPLSQRLKVVLSEADGLHKALYEKKNDQIKKHVSEVISAINRSLELSYLAKESRIHLEKILRTASQQLASTNDPTSANRKEAFQETYRQLIQIAKGYDVKHSFKYFYCHLDKSTWFQSETKPQNPINPEGATAKCGTMMK